jgi:hypothetical protein
MENKVSQDKDEASKEEGELKRQRDEDLEKKEVNGDQPAKKKKKFLGKTNFVNDDEYEDILESGWFYLDSSNNPQGPFTSKEMKGWFIAGFFFESTMVRRIKETVYTPIMEREEFKQCDISSTVVSTDIYSRNDANTAKSAHSGFGSDKYEYFHADESLTEKTDGYAQSAFFTDNGKFMPTNSYYASRGIPEDRAGRMLAHYLDMDAYQEKMRQSKAIEVTQRPKVTKKMVEAFKKKKVDKQRRRILQM